MENIIKVIYQPSFEDLKPALTEWKNVMPNSRLREEEGQGVLSGYLIHYVIDEITSVDERYVHYMVKAYKSSIKDIKEGKIGLTELHGQPAILPEKISLFRFLEYKEAPLSICAPNSSEYIDCTIREYFLGDKLCAIALINGCAESHYCDLGE